MKKVAIITGASSGIGKSTALQLQKDGYTVYGAARRKERMNDLESRGIKTIALDVTSEESMVNCISTIEKTEGRIDVLVNNAGYGNFASVEETPMEMAKAQYEVNVFGLGRMMQLVIPIMRRQKSGTIINISSIGGKMTTPFGGWYQSSKYAVESISDAARMEVNSFGIRVILIEPGLIESEWADIADSTVLKISGNGPYRESAVKMAEVSRKSYENPSPSTVVSDAISKALRSKNPKTRYVVGKQGKATLMIKGLLSDKAWDRMMIARAMDVK
jgi:NAD(P)-dependent dehydrogenase (short-subunit alcohol dehydrogenase family)